MEKLVKVFTEIDFDASKLKSPKLEKAITGKASESFHLVISLEDFADIEVYQELNFKIKNFRFPTTFSFTVRNSVNALDAFDMFVAHYLENDYLGKELKNCKAKFELGDAIKISVPLQSHLNIMKMWKSDIEKAFDNFGLSYRVELELRECDEYKKETQKLVETAQEEMRKQHQENILKSQSMGQVAKPKDEIRAGKAKAGKMRLGDIDEDYKGITIECKMFDKEIRKLSMGKSLLTAKVTDFSNSIVVKAFEGANLDLEKMNELKTGKWYRIFGDIEFDSYMKEQVLKLKTITPIDEPAIREDNAEVKRVELHSHTKMSTMDGVAEASALIERAARWGHKAIAITDHDSVQAFPEIQHAESKAQKANPDFKAIYGCEFTMVEDTLDVVFNPKDIELAKTNYVVFDFETTGLSARFDKPIEFGAVKVVNGSIIDRKQFFINPGITIPAVITEITGITDDMVKNGLSLEATTKEIFDYFADCTLVAHNAKFDLGFINQLYTQFGYGELKNPVIDTMTWFQAMNVETAYYNLGALSRFLKVTYDSGVAHRADYDADVLAKCLIEMIDLANKKGIVTDIELQNAQDIAVVGKQFGRHITVLAKNSEGLKDLFKAVSDASTKFIIPGKGNRTSPRITRSSIEKYRKNWLVGSSCVNGEVFLAAKESDQKTLEQKASFYDYIEVQPLSVYSHLWQTENVQGIEVVKVIINDIIATGEKLGKIVVASGDVHYVDQDDAIYRDILIGSKGNGGAMHPLFDRKGRVKQNPEQHFRTTEEMLAEFSFIDKELARKIIIENTNKIADMIEAVKPLKKDLYAPKMDGAEEKLVKMCWDNAKAKYGEDLPLIVKERLEKELNAITTHGFSVIYYISHLLVKKSLEDGYLVGSRGSVGSSIAATFSNISEVNPLPPHYVCKCTYSEFVPVNTVLSGYDLQPKPCPKCNEMMLGEGHDIPFETFLGFKGDKVPDIDLNFSGEYQPIAHAYTRELFGPENVFRAGTISTVADKTAFGYVNGFYNDRGITNIRRTEIERIAAGITGVKRTTGQHPGGIIVIPNYMDVYDFTPINFPSDDPDKDWKTTHFDFHSIHDNVLKLDILGHVDPTAIRMLQDLTGIDPKTIPTNDPKVMELFTTIKAFDIEPSMVNGEITGALGIPEFGTKFVREMLQVTKPTSFADLVVISGLSHGTDVYLGNAKDLIEKNGLKLKDVIGCRDDIMVYLINSGMDFTEAFNIMEFVRKGRPTAEPGKWSEYKQSMAKHGVAEWYMTSCEKIKYMFPKAHAVAYVMMAWRVAWFKTYYPREYYATYFTLRCDVFDIKVVLQGKGAIETRLKDIQSRLDNRELKKTVTNKELDLIPILEQSLEMLARGINFDNLSLAKSEARRFVINKETGNLIPPFASIDGLGDAAAQSLIDVRQIGEIRSIEHLKEKTKLNKNHLEILKELNVITHLEESDQITLF